MNLTWSGHYLNGLTADRIDTTVVLTAAGLRLTFSDGQTAWWPYSELKQTQGFHEGEHVRIERGEEPTEALVITDRAFVDALNQIRPAGTPALRRHGLGVRGVLLLAAGAAAAVLAYLALVPILARAASRRVPVTWERQLGDMVAEQLSAGERACEDPALTAAIASLTARLAGAMPSQPYTFNVTVLDDTVINAFAAPGGRIVVFRGLLEHSATPEELAGVLAHEMQHVTQRHGTQAVLRMIPLQVFGTLMGGEIMGAREAAQAVTALGMLRYGRRDEEEADREGMRLMAAAHLDPQGMIRFFETIQKEGPAVPEALTYLSTHPSTERRIAKLRELAATLPAVEDTLDASNWASVRQRCTTPGES